MKYLSLGSVLTKKEIAQAQNYILEASAEGESAEGESAAARISAEIIEPALERINKKTGQENDARYLGYAIEFALRAAMARSYAERQ